MRAVCLVSVLYCAVVGVFADDGKAEGTFEQKKILGDVGVSLASSGTWSFEKDRAFVWNTLKPVPSLFVATPTNYSFTAGGSTVRRDLEMKIGDLAEVFMMKEMRGVVDRVVTSEKNPVFESGGFRIPSELRVFFKNGDRLEIFLRR